MEEVLDIIVPSLIVAREWLFDCYNLASGTTTEILIIVYLSTSFQKPPKQHISRHSCASFRHILA